MRLFCPVLACGHDNTQVKVLVLDLDNTLIYHDPTAGRPTSPMRPGSPVRRTDHFTIDTTYGKMSIVMRPGLNAFLKTVRQIFDKIVVWSAGTREYVDAIVAYIFGQAGYKPDLVWARENCDELVPDKLYTKPLINLVTAGIISKIAEAVIIDDMKTSVSNNIDNAVIIPQFEGKYDDHLYTLMHKFKTTRRTLRDIISIKFEMSIGPVTIKVN